jgi:D-glycero-D-manno-heptose 1,7-bisphosphate phosphatase
MHSKMTKMLAAVGGKVDAIFYCPHAPDQMCNCRKPAPGLFEQIGERFSIDLHGVPVVGDTSRDVVAGVAVGCEPHLVLTGKGEAYRGRSLPDTFPENTRMHQDLASCVEFLISRDAGRSLSK